MESRRRPTASLVLLVLAFVAFPVTLLFWWLGTLPGHYVPLVGREVFGNIPGAMQAAFYVGVGAFLSLTLYLFSERARNWERGGRESRRGLWRARVRNLLVGLEIYWRTLNCLNSIRSVDFVCARK